MIGKLIAVAAAGAATAALAGAPGGAIPTGDAKHGAQLYTAKCGGCHSLDANRIGPAHRNVFGSRIASAPGFAYSPALRKAGGVWTAARLDKWLTNPPAFAPGTRMSLIVGDPADRADLIAFFAANSPSPRR